VDQAGFERDRPANFTTLMKAFVDYKEHATNNNSKAEAANNVTSGFTLKNERTGLNAGKLFPG
jgi:hypothetical protein